VEQKLQQLRVRFEHEVIAADVDRPSIGQRRVVAQ
jgi:hypothetical protein